MLPTRSTHSRRRTKIVLHLQLQELWILNVLALHVLQVYFLIGGLGRKSARSVYKAAEVSKLSVDG